LVVVLRVQVGLLTEGPEGLVLAQDQIMVVLEVPQHNQDNQEILEPMDLETQAEVPPHIRLPIRLVAEAEVLARRVRLGVLELLRVFLRELLPHILRRLDRVPRRRLLPEMAVLEERMIFQAQAFFMQAAAEEQMQ
jgi:hypothetical protein